MIGHGRTSPAVSSGPNSWIPIDIRSLGGKTFVHWCELEERGFVEPLFRQTAASLCREPLARHRLTSFESLLDVSEGMAPTGFIFHMSRCGSTLASQMLKCSARHTVVAEADPINRVLCLPCLTQA